MVLARFAVAIGLLALLLAILPWIGLAVAVVATAVSLAAWRRAATRSPRVVDGQANSAGVGLSQVATGIALSALAITTVWSLVATLVPKQEVPTLDCTSSTLSPADQIQCRELQP